jgi:hypothetical protein
VIWWVIFWIVYTVVGAYVFALFLNDSDSDTTPRWVFGIACALCGPVSWIVGLGVFFLFVIERVGAVLPRPWR